MVPRSAAALSLGARSSLAAPAARMPAWLALLAIFAAFAALRWAGPVPWGSDNDEYLLVAHQLAQLEPPVIAGVEGTKYPLGYPTVLAGLEAAGLPPARAGLVLNLLAVAATVTLVWLLLRPLGVTAALAGGAYVAMAAGLWTAAYAVMPDALFVLVTAAILLRAVRTETRRDVVVLTVLVVAAAALKSVGLLIGIGVSLGLLAAGRDARRLSWLPGVAAVATTGVMALAVLAYPAHTTGYRSVFWLANPFDASEGTVGLVGAVERAPGFFDAHARDLAQGVIGPAAPVGVGVAVAALLVLAGLVGLHRAGSRRPVALAVPAGALLVYAAGILLWPFSDLRFGLPLVPYAAAGLGWLGAWLARTLRPAIGTIVVGAALVLYGAWGAPQVVGDAEEEREEFAALHAASADAAVWLEHNALPDAVVASFDYREIARATDRPVAPLAYTSDVDALWQQALAGDYVAIVDGPYGLREHYATALVASRPDRFRKVYENDRVEIFEITEDR